MKETAMSVSHFDDHNNIKTGTITKVLIGFVFVFGLVSPTINVLLKDQPLIKGFIYVLATLILVLLFSFYRLSRKGYLFLQICMVLAVVTLSPYTVIKNVSYFYFIFIFYKTSQRLFIQIAIAVFVVNGIFITCQLLGVSEFFYFIQDYQNEAQATIGEFSFGSVASEKFSFLPQIRPSGIFPSPTYVSNFCIFIWYFILMSKTYNGRVIFFFFGFTSMLLGSTLAIFLVLLSIFFISYKKSVIFFLLGALVGAFFYLYYFPLTFIYNFNVEEFIESFLIRIISNDVNQESMLLNNPILFFIILLVMLMMPFVLQAGKSLMIIAKGAIVILLPVLIHNAFSSIQFWMTASLFLSEVLTKENFKLAYFRNAKAIANSDSVKPSV